MSIWNMSTTTLICSYDTGKPHFLRVSPKVGRISFHLLTLNLWDFKGSLTHTIPIPLPKRIPEDMGVSEKSGTPKLSILIGFSIINPSIWGVPLFLEIPIWEWYGSRLPYGGPFDWECQMRWKQQDEIWWSRLMSWVKSPFPSNGGTWAIGKRAGCGCLTLYRRWQTTQSYGD